jgi:hypothetical protein
MIMRNLVARSMIPMIGGALPMMTVGVIASTMIKPKNEGKL